MKKDNLSEQFQEQFDLSIRVGVAQAIAKHKEEGLSIYTLKNGEVTETPPDEIEVNEILLLIGDIIIRFSRLERVLRTALERVISKVGGTVPEKPLDGENPLASKVQQLKDTFDALGLKDKLDWFDIAELEALSQKRHLVRHCLVEDEGQCIWLSDNSDKAHRPVEKTELTEIKEAIIATTVKINSGSFRYKHG